MYFSEDVVVARSTELKEEDVTRFAQQPESHGTEIRSEDTQDHKFCSGSTEGIVNDIEADWRKKKQREAKEENW